MRKTYLALLALVGAVVPLVGQPPAIKAPPAGPDPSVLDSYLQRWEETMNKLSTLAVACTRTEIDAVYKTRNTYTGTIHFMKPAYFFWHMAAKDKPTEYERFICTGTYIYQYIPSQKMIKYYQAPKTTSAGKLADDSSLAFLFGMKAAEARSRYDLKLHNVDANYIYIDVTAKAAVDRADFQNARLVLNKETFLPRQLWFKAANNNEILWDLPTAESNAKINKNIFVAPVAPKDWQMVPGQTQKPQPTVARPQDKN